MLEPNLAHSESLPAVQRSLVLALTQAIRTAREIRRLRNIYKSFFKLQFLIIEIINQSNSIMKLFKRMGAEKVMCNIELKITSVTVNV